MGRANLDLDDRPIESKSTSSQIINNNDDSYNTT